MDDLETNLQNYRLQLQQVEAALTTSPDSEELLKLKGDLEEVIRLTVDLVKAQITEDKDEVEENTEQAETSKVEVPSNRIWSVGDKCLAVWVPDGQYYEATIESIEGEEVTVNFIIHKSSEVTTLDYLKELPEEDTQLKSKKQPVTKFREYQKKRKLKKQMRYKQLEEEREQEKNKWLAFSSKSTKKGLIKKSIFASPENATGRVGIGTCGVSGKGMTDFSSAEKWRK